MSTVGSSGAHHNRLVEVKRVLEAALSEPTDANLEAVGVALEGVELGENDDTTDEEDHVELHCGALARTLVERLASRAPEWLIGFTEMYTRELPDEDD